MSNFLVLINSACYEKMSELQVIDLNVELNQILKGLFFLKYYTIVNR
mgnify:CR=1 FL=1